MASTLLRTKADSYLRKLCVEINSRRVGSAGNQAATEFFAATVASFGFRTESPRFDCVDWREDGVRLTAGRIAFEAFASPYSLGCHVSAPLIVAATVDELEAVDAFGRILLLRGDLATEQLMPKNFPFYNPDHHKRIIQLLEAKQPQAIIAATSRNPDLVGALYPFPLFEDGDFDIPSVFMVEEEGTRLAGHVRRTVALESRTERILSHGCNVIARKGADHAHRIVIFSHIDARIGSPGANDNASGTIALLILAELLAGYSGNLGIEIVALNGEDYYAASGEKQWLALNAGRLGGIVLGINLDDVGYCKGRAGYSLYDCPADIASVIERVFSAHQHMTKGEPWYQGDHGLFLLNHIPALAITTDQLAEVMAEITHTPKDTPETVDSGAIVQVALALGDLLLQFDRAAQ